MSSSGSILWRCTVTADAAQLWSVDVVVGSTTLFHLNARPPGCRMTSEGKAVMNSRSATTGWGAEELMPLSALYGGAGRALESTVNIVIVARARGFLVVAADGEPAYLFRHRTPLLEPEVVRVDVHGGARVAAAVATLSSAAAGAGGGDDNGDDAGDPSLDDDGGLGVEPDDTRGGAPQLPWAAVAAVAPRASPYIYEFRLLARPGTWAFNARCGPLGGNDIAFHLNPRRNSGGGGTVVMNAKLPAWGMEEVLPFSALFPPHAAVAGAAELGVLVNDRGYLVLAADGEPVYTFRHRMPLVPSLFHGEAVGSDVAIRPSAVAQRGTATRGRAGRGGGAGRGVLPTGYADIGAEWTLGGGKAAPPSPPQPQAAPSGFGPTPVAPQYVPTAPPPPGHADYYPTPSVAPYAAPYPAYVAGPTAASVPPYYAPPAPPPPPPAPLPLAAASLTLGGATLIANVGGVMSSLNLDAMIDNVNGALVFDPSRHCMFSRTTKGLTLHGTVLRGAATDAKGVARPATLDLARSLEIDGSSRTLVIKR